MYKNKIKRIFDFVLTLLLLTAISPLLTVLASVLTFHFNGSPFFLQERVGFNNHIFTIIKFKTMITKYNKYGRLLPDSERLTRLGKLFRKTSLDELPQLINVLKGDMSLVGPRPLLVKYLPLFSSFQNRRHELKPGITGWTQVNGRNALSWDEKFKMDVYYVDHLSFGLDMKILWMTIVKVFKREGINAADAATMKPFTGNES